MPNKKPPIRLKLIEYQTILELLEEYMPEDLTGNELHLKWKCEEIIRRIKETRQINTKET